MRVRTEDSTHLDLETLMKLCRESLQVAFLTKYGEVIAMHYKLYVPTGMKKHARGTQSPPEPY
jgi:hypothetical protein